MILAGFLDLLGAGIALRSLLGGGLVLVEVHCLFGANGHIVLLDKVQDLEGMTKRPEPADHLLGSRQVDAFETLAGALHMQGVVSAGLLAPQSIEVVNGPVFELFQVRVFLGLGRKAMTNPSKFLYFSKVLSKELCTMRLFSGWFMHDTARTR